MLGGGVVVTGCVRAGDADTFGQCTGKYTEFTLKVRFTRFAPVQIVSVVAEGFYYPSLTHIST